MSDTIIVMNQGHILQQGDPETIYAEPASRFVADFIGGANLLPVRVLQPATAAGLAVVEAAWGKPYRMRCRESTPLAVGSDAVLAIRPEDITLSTEAPSNPENVLMGQVQEHIYLGNFLDCRVNVGGQEIRVQLRHDEEPPEGGDVYLTCPLHACRSLPS